MAVGNVSTNTDNPYETAQMSRLTWVFAVRVLEKSPFIALHTVYLWKIAEPVNVGR